MKQLFDGDWKITPAGGMTGEAYIAQSPTEKLFLKRNSSPFLAVLSAEGIVPKLLWTKRMENGDTITAQRWLKGRELKAEEMKSKDVAELLKKIHTSEPLLLMLSKLGKTPLTPDALLTQLKQCMADDGQHDSLIGQSLTFLETFSLQADFAKKVVCHSDINHNNWLCDQNGYLYLIDWDQAVIADPALDLAMLLLWYVDQSEWESWLLYYGFTMDAHLKLRLYWYMTAQTLLYMQWYQQRGYDKETKSFEADLIWLNTIILDEYNKL